MADYSELIKEALNAREKSYCPYSGYAVGAALLCADGTVFKGCNIENAAYGPSVCAERCAVFKAVSEGYSDFTAIAVVGGNKGYSPTDYAYPCGVCRQVLSEFAAPDSFDVCVAVSETDFKIFKLSELLPNSFGAGNLKENS